MKIICIMFVTFSSSDIHSVGALEKTPSDCMIKKIELFSFKSLDFSDD